MKISNETKVGLLTIVALTLLILGFNYLKGNNLIHPTRKLYAIFPDAASLETSNDVRIKGNSIGKVYKKDFTDDHATGVLITINLTSGVNIPKNAVASIESALVGSSYITIQLPADSAASKEYLKDGDTVLTRINSGLLGDLKSQVNPTLAKARTAIDSLTFVLGNVNKIFDPTTKGNIQSIIANLTLASASLQQLLNTETGMLAGTLKNLSDVTGNLKKNNDTITSILHNANNATAKLADLNLKGTMTNLDSTITQLKNLSAKLNSPTGSIGALLNDRKLYDNLNKTIVSLETLLDDVRVHPKRYVNISVFGKKDKGNYLTSPTNKDSL